jgi:hypothetical protein
VETEGDVRYIEEGGREGADDRYKQVEGLSMGEGLCLYGVGGTTL